MGKANRSRRGKLVRLRRNQCGKLMVPELDEPNTAAIDHVNPRSRRYLVVGNVFSVHREAILGHGLCQFPHRHCVCW